MTDHVVSIGGIVGAWHGTEKELVMQYTALGKTGLKVSRLGCGCMRLPMKDGRVDRDLSTPMLRRAVELGVNYFDSAVGYCGQDSERAVGDAMVGLRDKVVLSTKNPHYDKKNEKGWWQHLENSLERLRTDWIDIYKFHSLDYRRFVEEIDGPDGQIQWMRKAKEQGLIRHIGFSFHDKAENLKKIAESGYFEVVTLQYNLLDRANEPYFAHITERCGLAIVVMGPVGGGRLGGASKEIRRIVPGARSVPEVALRFVLANPCVSVALSGMGATEQLEENVKTASRKTVLSPAEKRRVTAVLNKFKKLADLYCTGCNYCMPCPAGVNISGNFSALNYDRVWGLKEYAKSKYAQLGGGKAAYCIACGKCLSKCPQNIGIIHQLKETVRALDDAYGTLFGRVIPSAVETFRKSKSGWSATIKAKLELQNVSDEEVVAKAAFAAESAAVNPPIVSAKLGSFGRKSASLRIACKSDGLGGLVDIGAKLEGGRKPLIGGSPFRAAFAAASGSSPAKAFSKAIPASSEYAVLRFAYSDDALHLSALVQSGMHRPAEENGRWELTDRLMLLLDARPPARFGRPSYDPEVFVLNFLAPGKEGSPFVHVSRPHGAQLKLPAGKSVPASKGYRVEAAIPWSFLALPRSARKHIGLDFCVVNHDTDGKISAEMSWSSGKGSAKPEKAGHLFLIQ